MAASVVLYEYTGASAGVTTSSDRFVAGTVRLQANDAGTEVASPQPIVRGAATVYSMERWMRMRALSGIVTSLVNPTFYTSGTPWDSGFTTPYLRSTPTGTTPVTPSSTTGFLPAHNYTSAAKWALGTYTVTTTPNFIGDYLVALCVVTTSSSTGIQGNEVWTFTYDES
jgi:hypothetical protein